APPTRLDLPDRTDPFGLHALSPQRDSVSIDFVVGSDFQIGISFCSGQNQPAAQGHLLRGSLSRFPTSAIGSLEIDSRPPAAGFPESISNEPIALDLLRIS